MLDYFTRLVEAGLCVMWLTTSLNGGRLHRGSPAVSGYDKRADRAEVLWLAATTETISDLRIKPSLRQKVSSEWQAVVSIGGVCRRGVCIGNDV